jgi:ABC-type antimicrobial peptide transport system permease subunit
MALLARAADPDAVSAMVPALREVVRRRDPEVPLAFRPLEDTVAASLGDRRFLLALVAGFTLIALTLAITGVYQVVAHSVAQRIPEIGVRVALGANPSSVIGALMRGARPAVGGGMATGLGLALIASGVLRSFLFDVKPTDPGTLAMVLALVAAVAALAALVPARRATRIDVVAALQRQ